MTLAYFGHAGGLLFIICIINNDLDRRPLTVNELLPAKVRGYPRKFCTMKEWAGHPHPKPGQGMLSPKLHN